MDPSVRAIVCQSKTVASEKRSEMIAYLIDSDGEVGEDEEEKVRQNKGTGVVQVFSREVKLSFGEPNIDSLLLKAEMLPLPLVPDGSLQREVGRGGGEAGGHHRHQQATLPHRHHPLEGDLQPQLDQPAAGSQAGVAPHRRPHDVVVGDQGGVGQRPKQDSPDEEEA